MGNIWGPLRREMRAERYPGRGDGLIVWVEISLRGDQRAVAGDLPQDVNGYPGVGHPGQSGVPEIVSSQVFVSELGQCL